MININHAVQFQHLLWNQLILQAQLVIDATCGKGNDLLYLIKAAHKANNFTCHFIGIDIQEAALIATKEKIANCLKKNEINKEEAKKVNLYLQSHDQVIEDVAKNGKPIDLIAFNLGYLPGTDHSVMTNANTVLKALHIGLEHLSKNGLITIVTYPGTKHGLEEQNILESYMSHLDQKIYDVARWNTLHQVNNPPQLYMLKKRFNNK